MSSDFQTAVDAVHEQLADITIAYGAFRLEGKKLDCRRRVLWFPVAFDDQPVKMTNAIYATGTAVDVLSSEWVDVEAHIVGTDFEDAITIKNAIKNAVHAVLRTSSVPAGGTYITQAADKAAHTNANECIVQRFRWLFNIEKTRQVTVTIIGFEQTDKLVEDATGDIETEGPAIYPVPP